MQNRIPLGFVLLAGLVSACASGSSETTVVPTTPPPTLERLIEEGDIVWLDDPLLYVLGKNGLSMVALGNPDAPRLIGRIAVSGTPAEIYLHAGHILALTTTGTTGTSSTGSSRLSVVDVRRPEAPQLLVGLTLEGLVTNSRLVGDVLYTASDSGAVIQSVNVADPAHPRLVDRLSLPLGAYGSHVLVTPTVFYIATESWSGSSTLGECAMSSYDRDGCTTVFAVDIGSPAGLLRLGASYSMTGLLKDRWCLDFSDGVLRVLVARAGWWTGQGSINATLRTFNAGTADTMEPLGWLSITDQQIEKVMSVRFDGPRAYVVTYRQTDPLFTIDLTDPAAPRLGGHLQSPGWLDFIIPRGDRVLGIGRDQDATGWRLQASLYDTSLLGAPRLMQRIFFGNSFSALPDQADNLAKVVRVLDALGVMLVPYNDKSVGYGTGTDGHLQVISWANDTLGVLGEIQSTQPLLRAVPLPPVHVAAVTESAVGVFRIIPDLVLTGQVDLNQRIEVGSPMDGGSDGRPPDGSTVGNTKDGGSEGRPPDGGSVSHPLDGGALDSSIDGGSHD
jgi:hypothetical protein